MKKAIKLAASAAIAALLSVGAQAQEFARVGGGLAGTYPLFAAKLAELINNNENTSARASVVPSDSEQAQAMLQQGELEFNIAYTWLVKKIADGKGGYGVQTPDVRHIITLYGSTLQTVARPGTITSLSELKEKPLRVWTGPEAQFFYQLVQPVIQAHGFEVDDINKAGGVTETMDYGGEIQAFQDGRLDVGFFAGGVPYGLLQQIERSPGFDLISMDESVINKLGELLPGITGYTIPAGTYANQTKDVMVPFFVNQLVTNVNVSDDLVYEVTKIMYEQHKEFHGLFPGSEQIDDQDVLANNEVPLHPGAERYYREIGVIK